MNPTRSGVLLLALLAALPAPGWAASHRKPAPPPHRPVVAHAHHRARVVRNARPVREAALPTVVIDPGHGGRDSGAVGATGLLEKDITLATALELRRELLAEKRVRVVLTRDSDTFVPLAARVGRTRTENAALFISIHADASPDARAHGASVYVRAPQADGGRVTRLPANSANSGAIGHALSSGTEAAAPGSVLLQTAMVGQLRDDIGMLGDPARQAHLFVLGLTGTPSVLVEMGFLSNRREEKGLRNERHRRVIAQAIRDAISDYLQDASHPGGQRT